MERSICGKWCGLQPFYHEITAAGILRMAIAARCLKQHISGISSTTAEHWAFTRALYPNGNKGLAGA
jgi:hypothetical protein